MSAGDVGPDTPVRFTGVVPPIRKAGHNADGSSACCPSPADAKASKAAAAAAAAGPNADVSEATFDSSNPLAYGGDALYILDIKTLEPFASSDVLSGSSDPYLKLWLDGGATCVRTPPRQRDLRPQWTDARDCQRMVFPFTTDAQVTQQAWTGELVLHVAAWDDDLFVDDFIGYGQVRVALGAMPPFVAFRHWPRAEHFTVQLWSKSGTKKAGKLAIRLSHCIRRNYIDAWLHHYHTKTLFFPMTQRTDPIADAPPAAAAAAGAGALAAIAAAASANAITALSPVSAAAARVSGNEQAPVLPRTSQWWRVAPADQPLILLELLQSVSNRLVRAWLAAPSQVYAGRSMIAALLLVHGALPEEEDDHKELRAGSLPVPPLLQTPSIAPALALEAAVQKPSPAVAGATAASTALAALAAATTRDVTAVAAAAAAAATAAGYDVVPAGSSTSASDSKHPPRQPSTHFSVFVHAPADGNGSDASEAKRALPVSVPWTAAAAEPKPTRAAAAVAAAAAAAGLSALAVQAGLRLGTAAAAPLTPLSRGARHAAQRNPDSALVKRVSALLRLLHRLMSVEHTGNTLRSSDHADVVRHQLVPISSAEVKQNTMCFFAFLTRVADGGGWESLLDPKRWAGDVVRLTWSLVFSVPAFSRVDWEDHQNDPLRQSLLDGVAELVAHADAAHPLTRPLDTKAAIEADAHTDCFGTHALSTQFGDVADANPWADMVARTRASFEVYDEIFPFRRRPSGSTSPRGAAGSGGGSGAAAPAASPPPPPSPTPKALTKQDSLGSVFDFGIIRPVAVIPTEATRDDGHGSSSGGGGGAIRDFNITAAAAGVAESASYDPSPDAPRASAGLKRTETDDMTPDEVAAALAASQPAASVAAAVAADAARVAPFMAPEAVTTDRAPPSPATTLDNARVAAARLREYSDPRKLFVAGGLERAAAAHALDVLFQNDRRHIEAHLQLHPHDGADAKAAAERRAFPLQLERPWFNGELEVAKWAARFAFGQPFVTATYTLDAAAVAGGPGSVDAHSPFMLFNHKRFVVLNALCNYLVSLPPWNLAVVFDTRKLLRHATLLGAYEQVLGRAYPLTPGFDHPAYRARWRLLCWRAATIARRAAEGHASKEMVLPPDEPDPPVAPAGTAAAAAGPSATGSLVSASPRGGSGSSNGGDVKSPARPLFLQLPSAGSGDVRPVKK